MAIKIYLIGCFIAFCLGWKQADEEQKANNSINQFGAAMIVIIMLSWIYVIYWLYWNNSGRGPSER
jgi:hypothetical protein